MDSRTQIILPKMTEKHSGLIRAYYTPIDWRMPLPSFKEITENPDKYSSLICHIGLNHKGLNWKLYRYALNSENYKVFVFALAYCMFYTNPHNSYAWQISHNAKKILNFVKKNNIKISFNEKHLLIIGEHFSL